MEKEIKLSEAKFCYKTNAFNVYRAGDLKIRLFSTLEGFITEETCFKLSKVETTRILLPTPFYQNGEYVGCTTKWREKDWIYSFYGPGENLKRDLIAMKEEVMYLSELGFDIGDMPFYCSFYDDNFLSFDGTLEIRESNLSSEELAKRNYMAYQDYLRSLIYSGMSEFGTDGNEVTEYIYSRKESPDKRLEKILRGKKTAGYQIHNDIIRHRNK